MMHHRRTLGLAAFGAFTAVVARRLAGGWLRARVASVLVIAMALACGGAADGAEFGGVLRTK